MINTINMTDWIDREEALRQLRVRPQTLYAYVSRGLVARAQDPAHRGRSLYSAADVARLREKGDRQRGRAAVAAGAMAWGEPAIRTRISGVVHGRLEYRGQGVVELSRSATLEEVAALLWQAPPPRFDAAPDEGVGPWRALAGLAARAGPSIGRPPERLVRDAAEAVATLCSAYGLPGPGPDVHERLAAAWCVDAHAADLLRRALVLMADHELNPSTFATRVVASTGASLAAALLAGLAAVTGPRHGGAPANLLTLIEEAGRVGADTAVGAWLDRGLALPGFGHPLYPEGDPRAAELLSHFRIPSVFERVASAAGELAHARANCDFALAALSVALKLPRGAPLVLFALARSVGWAAHAMEQAGSGELIRPRGRYET